MPDALPTAELCLDSAGVSLADARAVVTEFVARHCPWADRFAVVLTLSELLSNALRHATGWWRLRLRAWAGELVAEVADGSAVLPRARAADPTGAAGGLGMRLAAELTSAVEVDLDPDSAGKTVRARWRAAGPPLAE
ncbi:ATP-binding protein [Kitasatospora sp. NPDC059571]|uniref:ATP-binding protein n=1 Tax=Kitasatospora sp. NPDC059571 TaxID=3346871 RepID=UPI00369650D8